MSGRASVGSDTTTLVIQSLGCGLITMGRIGLCTVATVACVVLTARASSKPGGHAKCYQATHFALTIQDGVYVPVDQQDGAVVNASYIDSDQTVSNFGQLHVHTSSAFSDAQQMYAAGYAEGWLTAHRINQQVHNTLHYFKTSLGLKDDAPVDWYETP